MTNAAAEEFCWHWNLTRGLFDVTVCSSVTGGLLMGGRGFRD